MFLNGFEDKEVEKEIEHEIRRINEFIFDIIDSVHEVCKKFSSNLFIRKNQKLLLETKNAYNSQLANLRAYYGMRIGKSGGSMPTIPVAAGGIDAYSPDNLPPTTILAAQCAEATLTLIMLQNYERLKANNME